MSQIARPDSDISIGGWSPFPTDPATLFDKINEIVQNGDADYVYSDVNGDEFEVGLAGVLDPNVHTGHVIRCHAKSPNGSGAKEQIIVSLVENGTIIASSPATGVGRTAYGLIEYALSEAEANLIQNYANLRLRFRISKVNGGESIRITQAEFEVPDVVETTQYARPDGDITVGSWSPYPADPTTLFDKINEEVPNDDADYIVSSTDEDECELSLTDVADPGVGTGHKIRCWARVLNGGGAAEQITISLVENGNVRGSSGAVSVSRGAYALIEYILSEAEANAIQNYANLRFRVHINKTDPDEPIRITQAEFECPSAATEFVYAGDVPLTVLPDAPKAPLSKSYIGNIIMSALPSYASILDRVYAGAVPLAVLPDAPVAPLEKSYAGDIPLAAIPDFPKAILEKSYAGAVALALVPNSAYGLYGADEFVYAGDIPLTALPSYVSILDRVYQGTIPLVLTPNSIYSLEEILQEFVYGGNIPLFILSGYSSMLEKAYEGDIAVLLAPSSLCLLEEQVDVSLRAKRPGMIYTKKPSSFYSKKPRSATIKSMRKG